MASNDNIPRKKMSGSDWALLLMLAVMVGIGAWMIVRENQSARQPADLSNRFKYDISDLKKIDPALITYKESSSFEPGLESLLSMSLHDDYIFVAGEGGIKKFSPDGTLEQHFLSDVKVSSMWIKADGRIYAAVGNQVHVLDANGAMQAKWDGFGKDSNLRALTGNEDSVFVADAKGRLVYVCDYTGKVISKIANNAEQGLIVPGPHLDLHWSEAGKRLVVLNPGRHRIDTYDANGDLSQHWGKPSMREIEGFSGCCNPTAIAVTNGGQVLTAEKGLNRVKRYDKDGNFIDVIAGPKSFSKLTRIYDLDVDVNGTVYVLDDARKLVRLFKPKS